MERTHPLPAAKARLWAYRETIHQFLPFVLIRCTKYTNSRRLAETIAVYTFISAYRLAELLDGYNMPMLIDWMVDIVGKDLGNGPDSLVNGRLFEQEEAFNTAKTLARLDMKDCLEQMPCVAQGFDRSQFEIMIETIMKYLKNSRQLLSLRNAFIY